MIRQTILYKIDEAVRLLVSEGAFSPLLAGAEIEVTDPRSPEHGDYATNFALVQAKALGLNPHEVAEKLGEKLRKDPFFSSVEVAGPGFLNFRVDPSQAALFVGEVLKKGEVFARVDAAHPLRLNVEFVSVNPNGPITVGSGRGAAFGSTLCNVLEAAGHQVHREYYINDGVNSKQMRLFGQSMAHHLLAPISSEEKTYLTGINGTIILSEATRVWLDLCDDFLRSLGSNHQLEREQFFFEAFKNYFDSKIDGFSEPLRSELFARRQSLDHAHPTSKQTFAENLYEWYLSGYSSGEYRSSIFLFPEGGYKGDYVADLAKDIIEKRSDPNKQYSEPLTLWEEIRKDVEDKIIEGQKRALAIFEVNFDTWFSEQSLHDSGEVDRCIQELIKKGFADEEPYRTKVVHKKGEPPQIIKEEQPQDEEDTEGTGKTLWLRSTRFGDDQDRVLRRKDGRYTYIASDIAYHKSKFERGSAPDANGETEPADKLLTILGPDHHGYIGRLKAVIQALGHEPDALEVIIFQLVRFVKDGKPAPMRKRDGNIYALRDLYEEIGRTALPEAPIEEQTRVGVDVTRFFYLMRSHDTTMDFDIDLATKLSDENPVFYVQYAHARICSILRKAEEELKTPPLQEVGENLDLSLLTHPRELGLIKKICDLPYEIDRCAKDYGVHRLTTYALELARAYHYFYDGCRVIQPEEPGLTQARLALCRATQIALKSTFNLLGISAPERMERQDAASA